MKNSDYGDGLWLSTYLANVNFCMNYSFNGLNVSPHKFEREDNKKRMEYFPAR